LTAPTAADIKKGGALDASALSGGKANIEGVFTWTNADEKPESSGKYSVTFTPNDTENYESVTFMIDVTVTIAAEAEKDPLAKIILPISTALILFSLIIFIFIRRIKGWRTAKKNKPASEPEPSGYADLTKSRADYSADDDSYNRETNVGVIKNSPVGLPKSESVKVYFD
jgi:hypothetical protein